MILVANGLQKNTLFYKGIDSKGILLEYREIKPWEKEKRLVEWVIQQTGAYRKLIAYPAAQYLVKQVGNDQFLLEKEVEKLVCYCFEKSEISLKDVEAICVKQHHDTIWELGEFIFRRDASAAIQAARALLLEEQSALPLLRQVRFQFQTHFQICHLLNHENALDEIAREFPYMKGKILESHINQARSYGLEAFRNGIIEIDATEARIKNSAIDENILIEILLHRLTNPKLK